MAFQALRYQKMLHLTSLLYLLYIAFIHFNGDSEKERKTYRYCLQYQQRTPTNGTAFN